MTITFWYVEAERKLSQCISLYTWHLSGTRGTLARFSWINRSLIGLARHTATLERCFIFQQVGKKSKLREGNKLERAEKKKKKDKGVVKTGGETYSQSWRTVTSFSAALKNSNHSNQLDVLWWGKGRNTGNTEERTKAFNTYFCSIFGKKVSCCGPVITKCLPFQQ